MSLASVATLATVYRTVGLVLFAVVFIAAVAYVLVNILFQAKPEIGSELELAPNRKPYYDDEALEGPRLDRALTVGLLTLFVSAIGLPLYWIMEPGRQENAAADFGRKFRERGEELFAATGETTQALNCAGCHGNLDGGVVQNYNLTLPDGSVAQVDWRAPQLGTVLLRYSRDEITFILTYGRPGTPMPAWGVEGGGPLNEQQVQNLVDYLDENQQQPEEAQSAVAEQLEIYLNAEFEDGERVFESPGEALFNMGILDGFAGGAYSCARCHTAGWAYAEIEVTTDDNGTADDTADDFLVVDRASFEAATANAGCGGSLGFNLCDGDTERQFPAQTLAPQEPDETDEEFETRRDEFNELQDMIDFITTGSEDGIGYGTRGQGSGKMPGFGERPAEAALYWLNGGEEREPGGGMLTADMIEEIVAYERGLTSDDAAAGES